MTIDMKVSENGFEPEVLHARVGEETRLRISRGFARTCANSIQSEGGIPLTKLPLGEVTEVAFKPEHAGTYRFGCAMGMHVGGTLIVED